MAGFSCPLPFPPLLAPYLRLESWGRPPGRSCSEPPSAASGPRRRLPWGSGSRPAPPKPWSQPAAASAGTKRAGKKYHAVTSRAAWGTSTRMEATHQGVRDPSGLRCQLTMSLVPPNLSILSHYKGQNVLLQLGVFMPPHPHCVLQCGGLL